MISHKDFYRAFTVRALLGLTISRRLDLLVDYPQENLWNAKAVQYGRVG